MMFPVRHEAGLATLAAAHAAGGTKMLAALLLDLTFREVIGGLPHDAGAVVTYVLVALFIGFIWHGSRSKSGGASPAPLSVGDAASAGAQPGRME
jgi:hypothetical protein